MVVYGSMLFSVLSIISNTLTFCTQREIVKNSGFVSIQFDVTSSERGIARRGHRNRINEIQKELAAIFEIDKSLVFVSRPFCIRHGLRMELNIHVNHTMAIDINFKEILQKHVQNGEIAMIIKEAWHLNTVPIISDLKVNRINSARRDQGTVNLAFIRSFKAGKEGDLEGEGRIGIASRTDTLAMSPSAMSPISMETSGMLPNIVDNPSSPCTPDTPAVEGFTGGITERGKEERKTKNILKIDSSSSSSSDEEEYEESFVIEDDTERTPMGNMQRTTKGDSSSSASSIEIDCK